MAGDLVGKTLGEYELTEMIGEGGMATVYKGFQQSLKRWVAVKVLYYQEDTSRIRFQREAKAIAALRHRNILIIYEYGEQDGSPFIVMEYVQGGTLEDKLNGTPMDWKQAIELIIPIAQALHYAHQQGIIHRDVKPSNVLLPANDWPVLADFGLVKRSDEEQGLTKTGTFMGTPSYIAPEQARDADLDHRADLYSLGVMLFEMVTGHLPFDYENPNKILLAHVTEQPPPPRKLNPDIPPALEEIVLKTLKKSPKERYPDMQALIDVLKEVLVAPPGPAEKGPAIPLKETLVDEEESGGLLGSFKRLFGTARQAEPEKPSAKADDDTGSKTSPRPKVDAPEITGDELEGTVQLDVGSSVEPRLILPDQNVTINLPDKEVLIIGRTHRNSVADIDLEAYNASKHGVSRRHARLLKRGELWLLEDLGSLNGTFVNDAPVHQGNPVVLKDGDKIRLSHMSFVFMQS